MALYYAKKCNRLFIKTVEQSYCIYTGNRIHCANRFYHFYFVSAWSTFS